MIITHRYFKLNTISNFSGIFYCSRDVFKHVKHLVLSLKIKFRCCISKSFRVISIFSCPETNMNIMCFPVLVLGVMGVISTNHWQIKFMAQFFHIFNVLYFIGNSMILNFKIKTIIENL